MSQTILIEPDKALHKLYKLNLEAYALTDIIEMPNAGQAISLLKILQKVDLIITTDKVDTEPTAIDLYKYIQKYNLDIPMIVTKPCEAMKDKALTLRENIEWEILVKHACQILGINEIESIQKNQPQYVPIDLLYFKDINHTPCDVFIRLKQSSGEYKFVKRIHAQDNLNPEEIDKYIAQGLTSLYIAKDYQQYFVNFVTNNIIKKLEDEDLPFQERLFTNSYTYDILKDNLDKMGVDENTNELTSKCIKSMIKSLESAPPLADLLQSLFSSKISYAYKHAHLVTVIGNFIMRKQPWYEDKFLNIIAYVSFFSDITLKSEKQMQINSPFELENSDLSDDEKSLVINHAQDGAELVGKHPLGSDYIQLIITEHQGCADGKGFIDTPSKDLHPISRVFIIADAFVKTMLHPSSPKNKKDILSILYNRYTAESYSKIIKTLETKIA